MQPQLLASRLAFVAEHPKPTDTMWQDIDSVLKLLACLCRAPAGARPSETPLASACPRNRHKRSGHHGAIAWLACFPFVALACLSPLV